MSLTIPHKRAVGRPPQFYQVIEAAAGDVGARGGEGDVVYEFAVAEEAGERFGGREGGRVPEENSVVVGGGDETFGECAAYCSSLVVSGARSSAFCVVGCGGGERGVEGGVVVCGAQDVVGAEGEVVHPMGVRGQRLQ